MVQLPGKWHCGSFAQVRTALTSHLAVPAPAQHPLVEARYCGPLVMADLMGARSSTNVVHSSCRSLRVSTSDLAQRHAHLHQSTGCCSTTCLVASAPMSLDQSGPDPLLLQSFYGLILWLGKAASAPLGTLSNRNSGLDHSARQHVSLQPAG